MAYILYHADAEVSVKETDSEKYKITVKWKNKGVFMPFSTWETSYPIDLIEKILCIKGPAYLCDEIMRDESSEYVENLFFMRFSATLIKNSLKIEMFLILAVGAGHLQWF